MYERPNRFKRCRGVSCFEFTKSADAESAELLKGPSP